MSRPRKEAPLPRPGVPLPRPEGEAPLPRPGVPLPRPKVFRLRAGKRLVRLYDPVHLDWNHGRRFGPLPDMRFDHHPPPPGLADRESVWYAAGSLLGAVAESFGRMGLLDRSAGRRICLAELTASVPVVDLFGVGPRRLGLDHRISTTTAFDITQKWARALHGGFPELGGIRWKGRQAQTECVVLTDRVERGCLECVSDHELGDGAVWPRIARAARECRIRII